MRNIRFPSSIFSLLAAATLATACVQTDDSIDDLGEEIAEAGVRPTFDLWRADNGQFYFHLVASNGETLLASEGYQTRTGALGGLLSVLDNGGLASRYTTVEGADKRQYYLQLRAANRQIIATSEGYSTRSNATRAISASTHAVGAYLQYWATTTGARAQVFEGESGQFRFNIYAANGQSVLRSESYTTEAAALNGAFAVQENGGNIARYAVQAASNGQYYFNLKAANNQIIGTSRLYSTKASAERGRDALIALIPQIELL